MDTKGENIARPELRPQAGAHALVVPVSRKRAEGHRGQNGKPIHEKNKGKPTVKTNTPVHHRVPKVPKVTQNKEKFW
jgi:hypothetical protein